MYIKDMSISDQIEGFFLLRDAFAKTTMSGKPFLSMVLSDCTGTIDAQIWDYTGPVTPKDTGAVVKICGTVSEFKGTPTAQPILTGRPPLRSSLSRP